MRKLIKLYPIIFFGLLSGVLLIILYYGIYANINYNIRWWVRSIAYGGYFTFFLFLYLLLIKLKKVVPSNIVLLCLLITTVEIVCFIVLGAPNAFKDNFISNAKILPKDNIVRNVGGMFEADSIYHFVKVNNKDTVYDVHYSIDDYHKRITPGYDSTKNKYAIFLGCSITFGQGVEDTETMPYYFQKFTKKFNCYNFAVPSHGTNNVLARFQYQSLKNQVREKAGRAYYIFYWDHIRRSIGSMSHIGWTANCPYYYENKDGKLERKGNFIDGRKFTTAFYQSVYQTNIVNYWGLDLPFSINASHIDLVTDMIEEIKNDYEKQFGNDHFYCVMYPDWEANKDSTLLQLFRDDLKKKNVQFMDLNSFPYTQDKTLGGDPHPNPETNREITRLIIQKSL